MEKAMEGSKSVLVLGKSNMKYWKWCGEESVVKRCSRRPYLNGVGGGENSEG